MIEERFSFQYKFCYMHNNDMQEKKDPLHTWNR
jgi:hypothetical protein